jgi:hypothetical protein
LRRVSLRQLALYTVYMLIVAVSTAVSAVESGPDIHFDELEHDFGKINQNEKHTHVFKFRNMGDATLKIEQVKTSCGCTATSISGDEIPPKETGELEVQFSSGTFEDAVSKTVYVHSNDPDEAITKLKIKATIHTVISVKPRLIYFGRIDKGQSATKDAKIYINEEGVKITGVESTSEYLSAKVLNPDWVQDNDVVPTGSDNEAKKYSILQVKLSSDAKVGRFSDRIKISTDSPKKPFLYVSVQAEVLGEVRLKPQTLSFGSVPKGSTAIRKIAITKVKEKTLKITKVECSEKWLSTELIEVEKGAKYEIALKLKLGIPVGRARAKLTISTNHPEQPVLTVNVFAYITEEDKTTSSEVEN